MTRRGEPLCKLDKLCPHLLSIYNYTYVYACLPIILFTSYCVIYFFEVKKNEYIMHNLQYFYYLMINLLDNFGSNLRYACGMDVIGDISNSKCFDVRNCWFIISLRIFVSSDLAYLWVRYFAIYQKHVAAMSNE